MCRESIISWRWYRDIYRILKNLYRGTPTPRQDSWPSFKKPQYDGSGDVEYFIREFEAVAEANQWHLGVAFLNLRGALRDGAQDCRRLDAIFGIYAALRV